MTNNEINWINDPSFDPPLPTVPGVPGQPGVPTGPPGSLTPPYDPAPQYTTEQRSAKAVLQQTLGFYGLSSLADWAWQQWLNGIPEEQIYLDLRQTPEFKQRFPAMEKLAQSGHAIDPTQYVNYEQSVMSIFKAAGLPPGFYDSPDDFQGFLENNLALPEIQSRVDIAKAAVYNSDPATLQALQDFYGAQAGIDHIGAATAFFLDETKALPAIEKQFLAAQEAGAAARAGYGQLGITDAERLARLGIDPNKAQEQFGTLAQMEPLFNQLPGESGSAPTKEQGLAATFENNAGAKTAIENQRSKRKAVFQEGGKYSQTDSGMTGL